MTAPGLGFEVEEVEGADLGRVEAGRAAVCDRCGGESYTGPRCTRCTFASRPSPPWPVGREGWEGLSPQEGRAAHPEPAVGSRSGQMVPPPKVVEDLGSAARSAGWTVDVTYARGHGIHSGHGGTLAERESWAVRGVLAGRRFAAVHSVPGGWSSVWLIAPECSFFGLAGVRELKDWLREPLMGGALDAWLDDIRRRVAWQAKAAKVVACPGAPRCVLYGPQLADGSAVLEGAHEHRASGAIKIKKLKAKQETGA